MRIFLTVFVVIFQYGVSLLMSVSQVGNAKVVKELIATGAAVNAKDNVSINLVVLCRRLPIWSLNPNG